MAKKAKAAKKAPKARNQQDTTLRNNRASSRRFTLIEDQVGALATTVHLLSKRIAHLEQTARNKAATGEVPVDLGAPKAPAAPE